MTEALNISAELKDIVGSLGEIFLNIAESYPRMLSELERKTRELETTEEQGDVCHSLEDLVKNIQSVVDKQAQLLEKMLEKDAGFLDDMAEELEILKSLDANIDGIEDDSAELELISLNAMVTALKAGKNGGAFPYITEELQKVSKESAMLSKRLKTKGDELGRSFMTIVEFMNSDKEGTTSAIQSIKESFSRLLEVSSEYQRLSSSILTSINSNSQALKEPVHQIISEVQKHDIVRQSVDHIILSLEHVDNDLPEDTEDKLESLSYESRVYGFCFDILEDIRKELMQTFELFSSKSEELKEVVDFLKETGKKLSIGDRQDSCRMRITKIQGKLHNDLTGINQKFKREHFRKSLEGVFREIDLLDKTYSSFSRIIHWIKTINISSRVEAAKLPHLENMSFIIQNIKERTDSIEDSVEEISRSIHDFKKGSSRLFSTFLKHGSKNGEMVENNTLELQAMLKDVEDCSLDLENNMAELLDAGEQFKVVYTASRRDLEKMENLIGHLDRILKQFEDKKNSTDRILDRTLSESGLQSWELKGEKIKELINKFTIYVHKKKADIDDSLDVVDEGAESGEITLF